VGTSVSSGLGYAPADLIVVNDLDHGLTLAHMMNRMQAALVRNDTCVALDAALRSILD